MDDDYLRMTDVLFDVRESTRHSRGVLASPVRLDEGREVSEVWESTEGHWGRLREVKVVRRPAGSSRLKRLAEGMRWGKVPSTYVKVSCDGVETVPRLVRQVINGRTDVTPKEFPSLERKKIAHGPRIHKRLIYLRKSHPYYVSKFRISPIFKS